MTSLASFFSTQDLFDDSNLCILEASLESKRTLPILGTSLPYLSPKVVLFSFFSLVLFANSVKLLKKFFRTPYEKKSI